MQSRLQSCRRGRRSSAAIPVRPDAGMTTLPAHSPPPPAAFPTGSRLSTGGGCETSFAALKARADGFAARWQAQGIGPGDRVLIRRGRWTPTFTPTLRPCRLGRTVAVLPEPAMGWPGCAALPARSPGPKASAPAAGIGCLACCCPSCGASEPLAARPMQGDDADCRGGGYGADLLGQHQQAQGDPAQPCLPDGPA